ncbi:MAG: PhzF family phenazine biosynthesis protein, partial [Phycisphaerae bacterium]
MTYNHAMARDYFVVDAFTSEAFAGNAAGVVLNAEGLDEAAMQAVAAEFNLSETTFVLPASESSNPKLQNDDVAAGPANRKTDHRDAALDGEIAPGGVTGPELLRGAGIGECHAERREASGRAFGEIPRSARNDDVRPFPPRVVPVRFRWFTPTTEVTMCGHATVAGVQAMLEAGRLGIPDDRPSVSLTIETLGGVLTAFVERMPGGGGPMIWLDLVDPVLTPCGIDLAALSAALRLSSDAFDVSLLPVQSQDGDAIVFVRDVITLNDARPDFEALRSTLERAGLRGLSLATVNTLTPSVNVQSRFFAPPAGVDEDPVTGSVHGPLAARLVQQGVVPVQDGLAALTCVQGQAGGRAGLLYALVQPKGDNRWG